MKRTITIRFGALAPPLIRQLVDQGFTNVSIEAVDMCQRDADALTRIRVRNLIAPYVCAAGEKRLLRKIAKIVGVARPNGKS